MKGKTEGHSGGDDASVGPPATKRARGEKASEHEPSASTSARKKRRRAACLSELMNMPLDVVLEIVSHLHPLDLLRLSRTTKTLRATFLSRHNVSVWRTSRRMLDGLPECPEDMSEPAYAALLFDRICFLCGSERASWADFALRLRLCGACRKANILSGRVIMKNEKGVGHEVFYLVPCETTNRLSTAEMLANIRTHFPTHKFYAPDLLAACRRYKANSRDEAAVKAMVDELRPSIAARHVQAVEILRYMETIASGRKEEMTDLRARRWNGILERLEDLGYEKGDCPTQNDEWVRLASQPKLLTDRIWNNIRPKLIELIEEERERKARDELQRRIRRRVGQIIEHYREYTRLNMTRDERSLALALLDMKGFDCFTTLAILVEEDEVTYEDFLAIVPDVHTEIERYEKRAKQHAIRRLADHLSALERDGVPNLPSFHEDVVLESYWAYFDCSGDGWDLTRCFNQPRAFFEMHQHWRTVHRDKLWLTWVDVLPKLVEYGGQLLDAVGIPRDTSRRVLDDYVRSGRLFCSCGDPSMPLPSELTWATLMVHIIHRKEDYEKKILGRDTTEEVARLPFVNCHPLSRDLCCVTFLPQATDASLASTRVTIDDALRVQIEARRAQVRLDPVCAICQDMMSYRKTPWVYNTPFPSPFRTPEWIVYHLRARHGKEFEDHDIQPRHSSPPSFQIKYD